MIIFFGKMIYISFVAVADQNLSSSYKINKIKLRLIKINNPVQLSC